MHAHPTNLLPFFGNALHHAELFDRYVAHLARAPGNAPHGLELLVVWVRRRMTNGVPLPNMLRGKSFIEIVTYYR